MKGEGTEQSSLVLGRGRSLGTFEIMAGRWNPNCRGNEASVDGEEVVGVHIDDSGKVWLWREG